MALTSCKHGETISCSFIATGQRHELAGGSSLWLGRSGQTGPLSFLLIFSVGPSSSPLLQAQNIASPKWLPTTYVPGLSKTATCAAYCMDRFNYKYGRPSYFLLASSLLQHANQPHNFLTQPSLNYLSPPKDHLPPARFCSYFQLVSRPSSVRGCDGLAPGLASGNA